MIRSLVVLTALLLVIPAFVFGDCTRRVVKQNQKIVVQQKIVVVHDRYHYYSLDPYYQQQALAAQILKQLKAELKPGAAPAPKSEEAEPVAGKYQNDKLLTVVNTSCARCHGATSARTKLVTKDGKSLADLRSGKVWECFGLVNSGEMPKGGDNLDDESVKLFYDWAKNARK